MKKLHYNGFNNCESSCHYVISEIDDKQALVFYTDRILGTSVTNLIEEVTAQVLASDLPGVSPEEVRVFEHYNPQLAPIWEWMEVTFESFSGGRQKEGLIKKIKNKIFSIQADERYYVYNPNWKSVSSADIEKLSKLIS